MRQVTQNATASAASPVNTLSQLYANQQVQLLSAAISHSGGKYPSTDAVSDLGRRLGCSRSPQNIPIAIRQVTAVCASGITSNLARRMILRFRDLTEIHKPLPPPVA